MRGGYIKFNGSAYYDNDGPKFDVQASMNKNVLWSGILLAAYAHD